MRLNTLKYFYEKSSSQSPSFYYRGPFLEKFTNTILDISKGSTLKEKQDNNTGKKLSFMLVECFQNILKHAEVKENIQHMMGDEGLFSFKGIDGSFVINSINVIQNPDIERIEGLVNQVNALDESALKQFYLDNLRNNSISEKGGAGLGLIELARKSGEKILYKIDNIDDQFSHFHQQITMRRNGEMTDYSFHLGEADSFYRKMTEEEMVLLYKGDFSQKSILPLLELAEHNVKDRSFSQQKTLRAAHVTVEILQNISKHAKFASENESRFGIFMLGKNERHLFILAGNVVSISEKVILEEKLSYLSTLDEEELRELHRSTLRATLRFESKASSGLGLIEVAQASGQTLKYEFFPHAKDQFLFVLQVVI